jgi:hypothetical protein
MKTKQSKKKLDLARETLVPLQLDQVHGGAARTLTWTCDPTGSYGGNRF